MSEPFPEKHPLCILIGGPNGAGKTTFARTYLPQEGGIVRFLNADEIARGLSPLAPELAALEAGKVLLRHLEAFVAKRENFALESTLSGEAYIGRIRAWKAAGYRVELVYLKLPSEEISAMRVANRVAEGGHDVPLADIHRRFPRSRHHFENDYKPLADAWWEIDALSLAVIDSHDGSDSLPDWNTR